MTTPYSQPQKAENVAVLNSYADVQNLLDAFVKSAGVTPASAPHGVFWHDLTYEQFITGNVPNVTDPNTGNPFKILAVGNSQGSNIIQILQGIGNAANDFGQMPQPNPPYPGQDNVIKALASWIDRSCPNN